MLNIPVLALVCVTLFASVAEAQSTAGEQAYLEFQVDRTARIRESSSPAYPQRLLVMRVAGEVTVQFVVNEKGEADPNSIKVVKSTDTEFVAPVRRAVTSATYYPAEIEGRKVKQVVQMSFKFQPRS
jgi:TonB family protein